MTNFFKLAAILVAMTTLSACGGSSNQTLLDRTNAYDDTIDRVSSISTSGVNAMNAASGTARFSGVGALAANPVLSYDGRILHADAVLLGDANMTVNFNSNSLNGSITNLFGADSSDNIDDYSGTISINNGVIGQSQHNGITANYSGTVRGNGDSIAVSGNMQGVFLGNPSVRALRVDGNGTSVVNGFGGTSFIDVAVARN